jgi:hypothetical protein
MNLSRFAIGFLMVVPTALFIAAAATTAEPAPDAKAADAKAPTRTQGDAAANAATKPAMAPLRTEERPTALPGDERADDQATAAILAAIRADPGMAGSDVSVNTERGIVSLTGMVRNREQSAIASAYANRQLGVLRVDNELTIPAQ